MFVEIGSLVGYLELEDSMSAAIELARDRLDSVGEGITKISIGLAGLVASATAAGYAIVGMAEKGADVVDISENFEFLAAKAGIDAVGALKALREGTAGTITDMALMQSSLKMLNMGFKGSTEQISTMAKAARVMAEQGLGMEQAFNMITRAVTTGQPRMLARYGINIDLVASTKKLKEVTEAAGGAVDSMALKQAKSAAVIEGLTKYLKGSLTVTDDFKDKVDQAKTAIANFNHDLDAAVSKSPALNDAFDRVKAAFTGAFGSDQQLLIDRFVALIDWVSARVGDLAVKMIEFGAKVADVVKRVIAWWDVLPPSVTTALGSFITTASTIAVVVAAFGSLLKVGLLIYAMFASMIAPVGSLLALMISLTKGIAVLVAEGFAVLNGSLAVTLARIVNWGLLEVATEAAQKGLTAATLALSGAYTTLSARIAASTAGVWLAQIADKAGAAAKIVYAAVMGTTSVSAVTLAERLHLATVATVAHKVAAWASVAATYALGTAFLALMWIILPITVAVGAFYATMKLMDWTGWSKGVEYAILKLERWLGLINRATTDADLWNSVEFQAEQRKKASASAIQEHADAIKRLTDQMTGKDTTAQINALSESLASLGRQNLAPAVLKKYAEAALELQKSGGALTPILQSAIAQYRASMSPVEQLTERYNALIAAGKDSIPELKKMAAEAKKLQEQGVALNPTLAGLVQRFQETAKGAGAVSAELKKAQESLAEMKKIQASIDTAWIAQYQGAMEPAKVATMGFTAAQQETVIAYDRMKVGAKEISELLHVDEKAVKAFTDAYKDHAQAIIDKGAAIQAAIRQNTTDTKSGLEAQQAASHAMIQQALADAKEFQEKNLQATMSGTTLALRQIDVEERAKLAALTGAAAKEGRIRDNAIAEITKFYQHQRDIVNATYGTIEERVRASGIKTVAEMWEAARRAADSYKYMSTARDAMGNPLFSKKQIADAKQAAKDLANEAKGVVSAWSKLGQIGDVIAGVFSNINSKLGQVTQLISNAFKEMGKVGATAADKMTAAFGALGGVLSELAGQNPSKLMSAAIGAAGGAMAGASIGGLLPGGPVTAGIGAAIGALTGAIIGWTLAAKKAREANLAATEQIKKYEEELLKTYGSLENIGIIGRLVGVDLVQAWGDQSQEGLKHFKKLMDEFQEKMSVLQGALEKYGLSWKDLGEDMKKMSFAKIAEDLLAEFNVLSQAGVDPDKAIKGMSKSLSQLVIDAIDTGQKIPAGLQPILEKLIRMGGLTDEAARKMLGLAESTMPSLADITEAAGRYGLKLDDLGPKVQQLRITDAAAQIVKDFEMLTLAGVPFETLMTDVPTKVTDAAGNVTTVMVGMHAQVQDLVSKALKLGLELPESMRPLIQSMIDAGLLTDDTGEKLTDMGKLSFAKDLTTMFEELIKKLDEFIEKLTTPIDLPLDVNVEYHDPGYHGEGREEPTTVPGYASGTSGVRDFGAGTLAVLHGREAVVPEDQLGRQTPLVVNFSIQALDTADFQEIVGKKVLPEIIAAVQGNRRAARTHLVTALSG